MCGGVLVCVYVNREGGHVYSHIYMESDLAQTIVQYYQRVGRLSIYRDGTDAQNTEKPLDH